MQERRQCISVVGRLYLWLTYRLYDECAWAYDAATVIVSMGRWAAWRQRALTYLVGRRILELGFGTGDLMIEMTGRGLQVLGIDPSPAMHRITSRKCSRRAVRPGRLLARAQALPLADETFDTVIATFPSDYVLQESTLREAARVLVPGGRGVIIGLIASEGVAHRLLSRLLRKPDDSSRLSRYQRMAETAGFAVRIVGKDAGERLPVLLLDKPTACQGT